MTDDRFFDLPGELRDVLAARRSDGSTPRGSRRLKVRASDDPNGAWHVVRALDVSGFELAAEAPRLRGHVEIWEGGRMIRAALVVAPPPGEGPARYVFKSVTEARAAPPPDYAVAGEPAEDGDADRS